MRFPHHLIYRPSGVSFRLIVPTDLRPLIGQAVINRTLQTHDKRLAQAFALVLVSQYAQTFRNLRGEGMAGSGPPSVDDLLNGFRDGTNKKYKIDIEKGIFEAVDEADHARGMEAIDRGTEARKALQKQRLPASPKQVAVPSRPSNLTLEKAIQIYSEVEASGLKADTWEGRQRALKTFVDKMGAQTPVASITRIQASEWASNLVRDGVSKRTAVNYVSNVAQIFTFLVQQGHLTENVVKGVMVMKKREKAQRRAEGHQWEAFDVDQLKRIYSPENLSLMTKAHHRWAALLGLHSGARVGEVAQIYLRDIVQEQGIWCVRLTVESDGQSVKTESSKRLVPLHPDFLKLGFIEYVQTLRYAGEERLFPDVNLEGKAGKGSVISKSFTYHLQRAEVAVKPRRQNGRVGFHSLRKTVIQALQGTMVSDERRRAFVGHEQSDDVHTTSYMRPWTAEELSSLWAGLKWGEWLDVVAVKNLLS
jgi:integrase